MCRRGVLSLGATLAVAALAGCAGEGPEMLFPATPAETTVEMDFHFKPLPRIPLPNDLATRLDDTSPTGRRVNASMVAPTSLERDIRRRIDTLDGWGVYQQITVPFTGPLDVGSIWVAHRDADPDLYDLSDDVVYLIDVDPASPHRGEAIHLDLGQGNYPAVLESRSYGKNDPRGDAISLIFEEADEDLDGDGELDPGGDADGDGQITGDEWPEDLDADGVLDVPNYLPSDLLEDGEAPAADDLAGRADALMTFYERQTDTLLIRPMVPLRERTTYAVVVTRRLLDSDGEPVGSPYPGVHHLNQGEALAPLATYLPLHGVDLDDIAFAFSFSTQSIGTDWLAVRDGLYEEGVQGHIGREVPPHMTLEVLRDAEFFDGLRNPYVVHTETLAPLLGDLLGLLVGIDGDEQLDAMLTGMGYVDLMALGSFRSPQLFERYDDEGELLPYDAQSWPPDLSARPVPVVRSEDVTFWAYIPRKEVSPRGDGKQAPVVVVGHGYTSTRIESFSWAPFFAKHGIATIGMDCPSHGLEVSESDAEDAALLNLIGLAPLLEAVDKGRALDHNRDGGLDSGADFWTSYTFHTRDMVRQCALDYMQLVRTLRSFDGERTWEMDTNGDGEPDLAGDFDGDGVVDIGAESIIALTGSSLGGMMSAVVGAVEPEVDVSIPVCAGGGLSDIGNRSKQGGVREAVQLRVMSPLFTGTVAADSETMTLETVLPDLNQEATVLLGTYEGVRLGDAVVGENLNNGERGCALVGHDRTFRLGIPSDRDDPVVLRLYRGPVLTTSADCVVQDDTEPYLVVDTFGAAVDFQGRSWEEGDTLVALDEGLGLRRSDPEFRRFLGIAQLVLDPADPSVLAPHGQLDPLTYAATGTSTGTHTLVVTTIGDMNVPASTGIGLARSGGLIPYLEPDTGDRYQGRSPNQVILDTYTAEAVNTLGRFVQEGTGALVNMDVDNFSAGTDIYGDTVPRLDPPLRLVGEDRVCDGPDGACGVSGTIFPFQEPEGKHDIHPPGVYTDRAIALCEAACTDAEQACVDSCGEDEPCECGEVQSTCLAESACDETETFDIGHFFMNLFGDYIQSGGTRLDFSPCHASDDCPTKPDLPEPRPATELL